MMWCLRVCGPSVVAGALAGWFWQIPSVCLPLPGQTQLRSRTCLGSGTRSRWWTCRLPCMGLLSADLASTLSACLELVLSAQTSRRCSTMCSHSAACRPRPCPTSWRALSWCSLGWRRFGARAGRILATNVSGNAATKKHTIRQGPLLSLLSLDRVSCAFGVQAH